MNIRLGLERISTVWGMSALVIAGGAVAVLFAPMMAAGAALGRADDSRPLRSG